MAGNKFACSGSCDLLKSWGSLLMLWDRNQMVWESEIQTAYSLGQWHLCSPLSSVSGFNHSVFKDYTALNHCTGTLWLAAVGWTAAWHSVGGCGQGIKPLMLAWPLKGGKRGHLPPHAFYHGLLLTVACCCWEQRWLEPSCEAVSSPLDSLALFPVLCRPHAALCRHVWHNSTSGLWAYNYLSV